MLLLAYRIAKVDIFTTIFGMGMIFGLSSVVFFIAAGYCAREMYGIYYNTGFVLCAGYVLCTFLYLYIAGALKPVDAEMEKINMTGEPV